MFKIIKIIRNIKDLKESQILIDYNEKNKELYTGDNTLEEDYKNGYIQLPAILYEDFEGFYFIFDKTSYEMLESKNFQIEYTPEEQNCFYQLKYVLDNLNKIKKLKINNINKNYTSCILDNIKDNLNDF